MTRTTLQAEIKVLQAEVERLSREREEIARAGEGMWWLIEQPQGDGAYWWGGEAGYQHFWEKTGRWGDEDSLTPYMTQDADKAVRFRSKQDAESVIKLMPESWRQAGLIVTDHRWMSEAWRSTQAEADLAAARERNERLSEALRAFVNDAVATFDGEDYVSAHRSVTKAKELVVKGRAALLREGESKT